jgi:opacity protein-like surface antigen
MNLIKSRYIRLTGDIDADHPNDNTEYLNNGLELAYNETFFVRAGYRNLFMTNSEGGLSLGGGINYKFSDQITVMFNYGWTNYGRLNSVQFIDLGLQL